MESLPTQENPPAATPWHCWKDQSQHCPERGNSPRWWWLQGLHMCGTLSTPDKTHPPTPQLSRQELGWHAAKGETPHCCISWVKQFLASILLPLSHLSAMHRSDIWVIKAILSRFFCFLISCCTDAHGVHNRHQNFRIL